MVLINQPIRESPHIVWLEKEIKTCIHGASLVAQWLRIRLPVKSTQVWALVQEDPTCRGAAKPMHHNYWACVPQLLSPCATTTEACVPRARAPQQEKPRQWESSALQRRVAPARRNQRKACAQQQRPNATKNKINLKIKKPYIHGLKPTHTATSFLEEHTITRSHTEGLSKFLSHWNFLLLTVLQTSRISLRLEFICHHSNKM